MSRVHDALRRAEQLLESPPSGDHSDSARGMSAESLSLVVSEDGFIPDQNDRYEVPNGAGASNGIARSEVRSEARGIQVDWRNFLSKCKVIPFHPAPEAHLIDIERPHEVPGEEFRSLRTRLNHMQSQQDLHSIVVTSASPAEGKTFSAINLALAQAQLELPVLIADLDLRRPVIHNMFQCDKSPGFSDFLLAEKPLEECCLLYTSPSPRDS